MVTVPDTDGQNGLRINQIGSASEWPTRLGTGVVINLTPWFHAMIDADEAYRIGIANQVYDDAVFPEAVAAFAARLAAAPPVTLRLIKRATYQSARSDLRTSLDLIASHMAVVGSTADSAEALAAFREKRAPSYIGA